MFSRSSSMLSLHLLFGLPLLLLPSSSMFITLLPTQSFSRLSMCLNHLNRDLLHLAVLLSNVSHTLSSLNCSLLIQPHAHWHIFISATSVSPVSLIRVPPPLHTTSLAAPLCCKLCPSPWWELSYHTAPLSFSSNLSVQTPPFSSLLPDVPAFVSMLPRYLKSFTFGTRSPSSWTSWLPHHTGTGTQVSSWISSALSFPMLLSTSQGLL